MIKKLSFYFALCLLFGLSVALLHADSIVDEIIARVNDQIITRSDYEKAKASVQDELKQRSP
ncbi:MAG: hypothetical protein ACRD4I_04855, partial [Candidatus Angelobacter sp.]